MQIEINVPDGKLGDWEIDTFTISEHQAKEYNFRLIMCGMIFGLLKILIISLKWEHYIESMVDVVIGRVLGEESGSKGIYAKTIKILNGE